MTRQKSGRAKPAGQRQLRIGEEIRHVLAAVFERDTLRDPALSGVRITVTEVRPSPDLRHARVYVVPLGGGDTAGILDGLARVKPYLRRQLADRIRMKFIPDLHFAADTTFDEAERIARLLHKPEVARDLDDGAYGPQDREADHEAEHDAAHESDHEADPADGED